MSPFCDTYQDSVSHICSSLAIRPRRLRLLLRLVSGTFVSEWQRGKRERIPLSAVAAHAHTGRIGYGKQYIFVAAFHALFTIERIFGVVYGFRVDVRRLHAAVCTRKLLLCRLRAASCLKESGHPFGWPLCPSHSPGMMASLGQVSAQEPQSRQALASMT